MAVRSYRELAGRTFSHRFGEAPTAQRRVSVTLDNPDTTHAEIITAVGIIHGSPHPEHLYLRCVSGTVSENDPDPWHAVVTYDYELPTLGTVEYSENPLTRPDVWSFSTSGAEVPALTYYSGETNNLVFPLTNTAGDFFEGLTTVESEVRASISGNRLQFPLAVAVAVTNAVNDAPYLGAPKHTWKCCGISGQQAVEVVNGAELAYWQISVELAYRQSGWPLLLPNVGFNYLTGGDPAKAVVFVRDEESGNDVAATTPQPLAEDGSLKYTGGDTGPPDILVRRINPAVNFDVYFGVPPF